MKNRRKKRFNELEDENNNFYDEKSNNLIDTPNKKKTKEINKDEYAKNDYNIN